MITIDARKLFCPMPVIRLGEAIAKISIGEKVSITASDKGVLHDIPAWCNIHSQEIISINEVENNIVIIVKKIS